MISPGFKDSLDRNAKRAVGVAEERDDGHEQKTDLLRVHLDLGWYGGLFLYHVR